MIEYIFLSIRDMVIEQRYKNMLETLEMWCWRKIEKIKWTEKKTYKEVFI